MATESKPEDLPRAVQGDFEAFVRLLQVPESTIVAYRSATGELVLTKATVCRVLGMLLRKEIPPYRVQQWAFFVRRGYIADSDTLYPSLGKPFTRLHIEYERYCEDEINEITARLNEIGDLIDGYVSDEEIQGMLRSLEYDYRAN
jgi:hypothetical protein